MQKRDEQKLNRMRRRLRQSIKRTLQEQKEIEQKEDELTCQLQQEHARILAQDTPETSTESVVSPQRNPEPTRQLDRAERQKRVSEEYRRAKAEAKKLPEYSHEIVELAKNARTSGSLRSKLSAQVPDPEEEARE